MIEVVIISILSVLIIVLTGIIIRYRSMLSRQGSVLGQTLFDNAILLDQLEQKHSQKDLEQTEGFVKFLSESRDWAFEYIETVQGGLNKFVEVAGPRLEYFDKYGRVVGSPHSEGLEDILAAYRELQKLLPEENKQGEIK